MNQFNLIRINNAVQQTRIELSTLLKSHGIQIYKKGVSDFELTIEETKIFNFLDNLSPALADSYKQVKADLFFSNRMTWIGTVHELRQVLSTSLLLLAPDQEVVKQSWYKNEIDTKGPTQRQRVKYILKQKRRTSSQIELTQQICTLDEVIENVVRSFYGRASDASHRGTDFAELKRMIVYFDTFAKDLFDI
mgnify:CR=1 FL=1